MLVRGITKVMHFKLGKHNEAIESYDRAVKIDPNYVLGWINKGNVLAKLGRQKDANRCFARARELGFGETTRKQESSDLEKQQQSSAETTTHFPQMITNNR
jgi:tetratricopeptide (TPR) repeat protein